MTNPRLREMMQGDKLIVAPGVFDLISTLLAAEQDCEAVYASGYWLTASYLGEPDVGIATYRDFETRLRLFVAKSKAPLIADADTGFGGLINVEHSVRGYEAIGVSAIQIEDQEFPKKCGHSALKRIVPIEDMVRKIKVAVASRDSKDFQIIARTDALLPHGIDDALRRAEAYAKAGADILFVETPQTAAEMERICNNTDLPQMINLAHGGKTPILPLEDIAKFGYRLAIFPSAAPLAAIEAMRGAYKAMATRDQAALDQLSLANFSDFGRLIGMERVAEFDRRWAED